MRFTSSSEEETKAWAKQLVQAHFSNLADTPLVFTLEGEMGAGKTQFAKGVAEALGVKSVVSSPSYVLTREYEGELGRLVHIDCWRTPEITPEELQLEQYLSPETVLVIEWPAPLVPYLRDHPNVTLVMLKMQVNGGVREIKPA
jgi:tRNA threonylcarbamoyladenosine biosynthesis protein TsaE